MSVDTWELVEQARESRSSAPDDYAGLLIRLVATIVDGFIFGIPMAIVIVVLMTVGIFALAASEGSGSASAAGSGIFTCMTCLMIPAILLGILLYNAGFESSRFMATPGKMLVGIIVTDLNGNRISFGKAMLRALCKYILNSFLYIGSLYILISDKKQGLYDVIAGTIVVKKD